MSNPALQADPSAIVDRTVLLVEDDATVAEVASSYLRAAGLLVTVASDGFAAMRALEHVSPDLIVLDRMLPGIDGLEVCRRIRLSDSTPIIMLTALGSEEDRIDGLEAGADDYLTKPFSPRELVLRAQSILRRSVNVDAPEGVIHAGPFVLDPAARTVTREGRPLSLTVREFDLLEYLMKRPGQAFGRAELLSAVWGWTVGDLSTVTVHVRRLREKIETDIADPRFVATVWGVGYRFDSGCRMPPADLAALVGIALAASLLVALAGVVALVLLRRASLRIQLGVMVAVAVVAVAASMIAVARWMFISSHDLTVGVTVACVSGAVSLAVCLVLASLVTRNLRQLRLAARELDSGELTALSGTPATAEFHQLALELRATSERLAESRARERQLETARRQFVAGISHDLRTPLAGIRAMSEALEDGLVDDQDRYLREMRAKVEQLSGLVDDLFQLSKIDAGMLELAVSEVSLYDIVSDAVADLGSSANGRDITVESSRTEDLTVRADPRELARAISNLLLNAVQHTAPGTPITVIAGRSTDGRPSISVIDQGGGIREDDLERVFEPGWRGASARSPLAGGRTAGAGLGLAIVAGIVNAHSGEATVRNIPGGCRFDLVLPA